MCAGVCAVLQACYGNSEGLGVVVVVVYCGMVQVKVEEEGQCVMEIVLKGGEEAERYTDSPYLCCC